MFIAFALASCSSQKKQSNTIDVHWKLNENLVNSNNEAEWQLTLINNSDQFFPASDWSLCFNIIAGLRTADSSHFVVEHVNGDLCVLKPRAEFKGLKKGDSVSVTLFSNLSIISKTDVPLGFFIVHNNKPEIALECKAVYDSIPLEGLQRRKYDILPVQTPEIVYEKNIGITKLKEDDFSSLIPAPGKFDEKVGFYTLSANVKLYADKVFENEAAFLKKSLNYILESELSIAKETANIHILMDKSIDGKEAYNLEVNEKGVQIRASESQGAFYGIQSLLGLINVKAWSEELDKIELSFVTIEDEPRFIYRGLMLDVARNFQSKKQVLKLLDAMAFYKLNKFHFHICDDEGWRVEIKDLPELTEFGAKRLYSLNEEKGLQPSFSSGANMNNENSSGSGFYSREDFIEIVNYARERHIEVIPEVDLPGHARAAILSMKLRYNKYIALGDTIKATEYLLSDLKDTSKYRSVQGWNDNVINVGMESTYAFITKITDELDAMFKEAGADLKTIHTGGDEVPHGVWKHSPECHNFIENNSEINKIEDLQQYFIKSFSDLLQERNIVAAGWEEIGLLHGDKIKPNPEFVGKNLQPTVWNNMWNSGAEDIGYQLANAGYPVVLAHVTNFYFDLAYCKHPEELGAYWAHFVDARRPWEYTPLDIAKCAEIDRYGQKVDAEKLNADMEHLTAKGEQNILGIQGCLWSENSLSSEINDYQIFPKLLGLAERAWAKQPDWAVNDDKDKRVELREADWNKFVNKVGQDHMIRMNFINDGILYRIPTPGAKIEDGILFANIRYPGLQIRYSLNSEEPTLESEIYSKPVEVTANVKLRAFNALGRGGRSVEVKF